MALPIHCGVLRAQRTRQNGCHGSLSSSSFWNHLEGSGLISMQGIEEEMMNEHTSDSESVCCSWIALYSHGFLQIGRNRPLIDSEDKSISFILIAPLRRLTLIKFRISSTRRRVGVWQLQFWNSGVVRRSWDRRRYMDQPGCRDREKVVYCV